MADGAQVVFAGASDEQQRYIESLEERVAFYEQDAFERVQSLRERVRLRLGERGWPAGEVEALLADDGPPGGGAG